MDYLIIFSFTVLQTVPLIMIFLYVFRENIVIPPHYGIIVSVLLQAVFVLISGGTVAVMESTPTGKLASAVVTAILQWFLIFWFTDLSGYQTLFVIFIMHSIVDDIQLSVQMMYRGKMSVDQIINWKFVGWIALFAALYLPLFYYFLKKEFQPLVAITRDYRMWKYICLIPGFVFIMYRVSICPDYFNQDFTWYPALRFLPYIWTIGTFTIYYVVINSLRVVGERNALEQNLRMAEMMSASHTKQYHALKESIETEKRSRHDFRHVLLLIEKYAQEEDCGKILEYIQPYINSTRTAMVRTLCANPTMDAVLQHFVDQAEDEGIQVRTDIRIPEELSLTETEICVLVGNLMENALEACRRQVEGKRMIRVRMEKWKDQMLSICVENTYSGSIRQDQGRYLSSKRDEVGIGLSSIAYIVEQHQGLLKVQHQDKIFSIRIFMNC